MAVAVELPVEDPRWLELVLTDPAALPFHHPAWTLLLSEAYGFRPFVLGLVGASRGLAAGIPFVEVGGPIRGRRWISLPFSDACPPLVALGGAESLAAEIDHARQGAGVASVEMRAHVAGAVRVRQRALLHALPLAPDAERVAATFRPSVRRNIRSAQRGRAVVRVASSEADITAGFYRLHVETRRRLGLPVQPVRFFQLLWRRLIQPGLGRVLLVDLGAETVASAVFLNWNRTVFYKYGASDPRYWSARPNNLLFWEAIKWACENGYDQLEFGRTDLDSPSLRRFKLGWGAVEHLLDYSFLGATMNGRRGDPPRIVRSAIRRSPRWVVRALGEIFYRGAA